MKSQYVDIDVTRRKFDFELGQFIRLKESNRKRGVIILDASFRNIYLAFSAINLNPSPIIFAVKINFENYDLEPLSVQFVNPFTFELINNRNQLLTHFNRKVCLEDGGISMQSLLVQNNGKPPFICIPGIREYHNHPAHTGDSWLLHRRDGEGTLGFIVDKLYEYGISGIACYQVPGINIQGPNINYQAGNFNILSLPVAYNKIPE